MTENVSSPEKTTKKVTSRKKKQELSPKRERFVQEYLVDFNGTQAAIRAGYSERTANEQAARLLAKVSVKSAVEAGKAKTAAKLDITAERVLKEISLLAYSNIEDYTRKERGELVTDFSKVTRDQMAAVQELTTDTTGGTGDGERKQVLRTRFKLADKGLNLERLGRHLKLFTDKVEVEDATASRVAEMLREARKRSK